MTVSINDKLRKYKSLFSTTLSTGIGTGTGDTITPASVSGLPTDTPITLTFDRVDSGGVATPTKLERIRGIVSGGNFISYVRGKDGTTEQAHSAGAVIEMIWNADDLNDMVDWGVVEHNQDGTHKSALVTTLKATASEVATGTEDAKIVTPLAAAPYGNSSMARQAVINGNFDVWQRGTSFNNVGSGKYTSDRWYFDSIGATYTVTRQDGTGVIGSQYCLRSARNASSTATDAMVLRQALETANSVKFRGKKLTLSFYARAGANYSATSSILTAQIRSGTGSDAAPNFTGDNDASSNLTLTTTWTKYTLTTPAVIGDTKNQIGIVMYGTPTGTAGAADYFEITQVQLCAGDVALPFQPKSEDEERQACLRYCWVPDEAGVAVDIAQGQAYSTTGASILFKFPKRMRVAPNLTATAGDWKLNDPSTGAYDVTSIAIDGTNTVKTREFANVSVGVASGLTANRPYLFRSDGGGTRVMIFDAEL